MARQLREFDPTTLGYLGVLSVPGYVYEPLAILRLFALFFLFWFWPAVRGLFGDPTEDSSLEFDRGTKLRFWASSLLSMLNPFVLVASINQLTGQLAIHARYRDGLPSPETYAPETRFSLPFSGRWTAINGGSTKETSHSWEVLTQRYAYDFVVIEDGTSHAGEGTRLGEYYCFDEPILAPADGEVVAAADGHRDCPYLGGWVDPFQRDLRGNYVTIRHAEDEYSVLAHLKEGSVTVREGECVERGQPVGRCGNSGNSSEPHLHFHVQDRPEFFLGAGLPVEFVEYAVESDGESKRRETGFVERNQTVRSV
ncbi:M23 family metallopeptidase [Halalkalicoccus jeotgali]|uniref:Peptidase M23 n=1 Tax=Halalkalicoccus jeotgali (strain DSM 18796 / CECT 7217 / JCM 14584 / KCTC 4019 / B3) TaxID=795797 RepID=D8J5I2_HALJB|nr:M23 family metallopeptidase [Halalkalicoccus jeotgali]ADJ15678.1 Peptidase M23 [Halalkalicoccus jeotgali B3]ELY36552.1 Peptidase M23 [Halalkalicoccus jeotgali B3]